MLVLVLALTQLRFFLQDSGSIDSPKNNTGQEKAGAGRLCWKRLKYSAATETTFFFPRLSSPFLTSVPKKPSPHFDFSSEESHVIVVI